MPDMAFKSSKASLLLLLMCLVAFQHQPSHLLSMAESIPSSSSTQKDPTGAQEETPMASSAAPSIENRRRTHIEILKEDPPVILPSTRLATMKQETRTPPPTTSAPERALSVRRDEEDQQLLAVSSRVTDADAVNHVSSPASVIISKDEEKAGSKDADEEEDAKEVNQPVGTDLSSSSSSTTRKGPSAVQPAAAFPAISFSSGKDGDGRRQQIQVVLGPRWTSTSSSTGRPVKSTTTAVPETEDVKDKKPGSGPRIQIQHAPGVVISNRLLGSEVSNPVPSTSHMPPPTSPPARRTSTSTTTSSSTAPTTVLTTPKPTTKSTMMRTSTNTGEASKDSDSHEETSNNNRHYHNNNNNKENNVHQHQHHYSGKSRPMIIGTGGGNGPAVHIVINPAPARTSCPPGHYLDYNGECVQGHIRSSQ